MGKSQEKCDDLLVSLRKIIRAIDLHSKQLVQKYGLTGPQMLLLKTASDIGEGINSKQLAEKMSLSQATVTSILDRLVEKGYITRKKSLKDKRKVLIYTTEKAKAIFRQNPTLLQEDFISRFEALKDWEQTLILSSLQRIAEMMHAKTIEAAPVLSNLDLSD